MQSHSPASTTTSASFVTAFSRHQNGLTTPTPTQGLSQSSRPMDHQSTPYALSHPRSMVPCGDDACHFCERVQRQQPSRLPRVSSPTYKTDRPSEISRPVIPELAHLNVPTPTTSPVQRTSLPVRANGLGHTPPPSALLNGSSSSGARGDASHSSLIWRPDAPVYTSRNGVLQPNDSRKDSSAAAPSRIPGQFHTIPPRGSRIHGSRTTSVHRSTGPEGTRRPNGHAHIAPASSRPRNADLERSRLPIPQTNGNRNGEPSKPRLTMPQPSGRSTVSEGCLQRSAPFPTGTDRTWPTSSRSRMPYENGSGSYSGKGKGRADAVERFDSHQAASTRSVSTDETKLLPELRSSEALLGAELERAVHPAVRSSIFHPDRVVRKRPAQRRLGISEETFVEPTTKQLSEDAESAQEQPGGGDVAAIAAYALDLPGTFPASSPSSSPPLEEVDDERQPSSEGSSLIDLSTAEESSGGSASASTSPTLPATQQPGEIDAITQHIPHLPHIPHPCSTVTEESSPHSHPAPSISPAPTETSLHPSFPNAVEARRRLDAFNERTNTHDLLHLELAQSPSPLLQSSLHNTPLWQLDFDLPPSPFPTPPLPRDVDPKFHPQLPLRSTHSTLTRFTEASSPSPGPNFSRSRGTLGSEPSVGVFEITRDRSGVLRLPGGREMPVPNDAATEAIAEWWDRAKGRVPVPVEEDVELDENVVVARHAASTLEVLCGGEITPPPRNAFSESARSAREAQLAEQLSGEMVDDVAMRHMPYAIPEHTAQAQQDPYETSPSPPASPLTLDDAVTQSSVIITQRSRQGSSVSSTSRQSRFREELSLNGPGLYAADHGQEDLFDAGGHVEQKPRKSSLTRRFSLSKKVERLRSSVRARRNFLVGNAVRRVDRVKRVLGRWRPRGWMWAA